MRLKTMSTQAIENINTRERLKWRERKTNSKSSENARLKNIYITSVV